MSEFNPKSKYTSFKRINLNDRKWPNNIISKAPVWCSVDLRDGNQSLIEPMDTPKKLRLFKTLVSMGFKEIEIGFPSASDTDYNFCRYLIENKIIPNDVTIQVLTQAREHLIDKTFESLIDCNSAIIHLYNSVSTLQRKVVFKQDMQGVKEIALDGAKYIYNKINSTNNKSLKLQYSPESFTGTELDYALEVCEEVLDCWEADADNPVIINLPATVEMSTPNIYADQIEWMINNFSNRERVIVSLHPHNDRGTGVAATELALMAGADRVEGTLFGNGERTGNVDIVTLGLNMFTQGVDPKLDFKDVNQLIETAEFCTQLPIHQRHPYAGSLVHTAFSGSHQDAIRKGMEAITKSNQEKWEVPYLPIDPSDIGKTYEAIIRVNSQSGKAGSAWLLEQDHNIFLPRGAQIEFSQSVQKMADKTGKEISSKMIWDIFSSEYLEGGKFKLINFDSKKFSRNSNKEQINATVNFLNENIEISASGNGPISAFVTAMRERFDLSFRLSDFGQNTRSSGSTAEAAAYVEIKVPDEKGKSVYGVGIDTSITLAPIKAVISAINRI
ncbi:MAG: 2-isopropylmalate synthase [SAR116 cluster bacterium]|nr:2-isopropylmalate synthase [SAR116 cluster bacterium]